MKKIVTHKPPHHLDEVMAVVLIIEETDKLIKVMPQEKIPEDADIVIDIGMKYDGIKYFDHHQDKDLPSSVLLVSKDMDLPQKIREFFHAVSEKDINGKINFEKLYYICEAIILKLFEKNPYLLKEILHQIIEEERRYEDIKKQIEIKEYNNLKILCVPQYTNHIRSLFNEFNADVIIIPNQFNSNHTNIIKNTQKPTHINIDVTSFANNYPIIFVHATKFMCVVDCPYQQFINFIQ